jgi:hypothetical protein
MARTFNHVTYCHAALIAWVLLSLTACAHTTRSQSVSATCDGQKYQQLVSQGDDLLAKGQWYQAHLVGHALISIGGSCDQGEIAVPATIHGLYIRAVVARETRDPQAVGFVNLGLTDLATLKQHSSESPAYANLYDEMEPKFLELQGQLR